MIKIYLLSALMLIIHTSLFSSDKGKFTSDEIGAIALLSLFNDNINKNTKIVEDPIKVIEKELKELDPFDHEIQNGINSAERARKELKRATKELKRTKKQLKIILPESTWDSFNERDQSPGTWFSHQSLQHKNKIIKNSTQTRKKMKMISLD